MSVDRHVVLGRDFETDTYDIAIIEWETEASPTEPSSLKGILKGLTREDLRNLMQLLELAKP